MKCQGATTRRTTNRIFMCWILFNIKLASKFMTIMERQHGRFRPHVHKDAETLLPQFYIQINMNEKYLTTLHLY